MHAKAVNPTIQHIDIYTPKQGILLQGLQP